MRNREQPASERMGDKSNWKWKFTHEHPKAFPSSPGLGPIKICWDNIQGTTIETKNLPKDLTSIHIKRSGKPCQYTLPLGDQESLAKFETSTSAAHPICKWGIGSLHPPKLVPLSATIQSWDPKTATKIWQKNVNTPLYQLIFWKAKTGIQLMWLHERPISNF